MDAITARHLNLQALVATLKPQLGTQKAIAIHLDMAPSYLNQLLNGKKMGDDVARKIERAAGLSHGWLDQPRSDDDAGAGAAAGSQDLRIDPEIIASAIRLVRLTFANLGIDDFSNEEDGTPLAYAYEYLYQRGEATVTPDNLIDFSKALAQRLREKDGEAEEGAPAAGTLEALAQVIAQRVARRDAQRPKLRLVENPRPSTIDGVTRDSILRRIRWLRDHYNLGCLIDQATFNTPGIDCLDNDALVRLHRKWKPRGNAAWTEFRWMRLASSGTFPSRTRDPEPEQVGAQSAPLTACWHPSIFPRCSLSLSPSVTAPLPCLGHLAVRRNPVSRLGLLQASNLRPYPRRISGAGKVVPCRSQFTVQRGDLTRHILPPGVDRAVDPALLRGQAVAFGDACISKLCRLVHRRAICSLARTLRGSAVRPQLHWGRICGTWGLRVDRLATPPFALEHLGRSPWCACKRNP